MWWRAIGPVALAITTCRMAGQAASATTEGRGPLLTLVLRHDGLDRETRLQALPRRGERVPLVILIHCSTDTPDGIASRSGFDRLAAKEGFYLAMPEVAGPKRGWTAHPAIFGKTKPPSDDIGYFRALIERLVDAYPVDPKRIYVVGHLSGGMMAYRLAAEMADVFAGVGVVNATIGVEATKTGLKSRVPRPSRSMPVVAFHGWSNEVLPYDGGRGSRGNRAYMSVNESIDFWKHVNGCQERGTPERFGSRDTVRITYPSPDGRADVVLFKLPKANHEWPRAIVGERGEKTTVAELMWAFLSRQSR
ncbi:MAG TPA: PHB depolymerase family esterase [Fimbriimonadaceae bacterium]|nr:PHB depolymerase family esterase [Fimbriimonadaceae bacterium]